MAKKTVDLRHFDDIALVTDLKSNDRVLVYGKSYLTGISNLPKAEVARRGKDLSRLASENKVYDRIYVIDEDTAISDVGMMKLTAMNAGLLVFFLYNDDDRQSFVDYFEKSYPWAEHWTFNTSAGVVFVTTAHGAPDWMN